MPKKITADDEESVRLSVRVPEPVLRDLHVYFQDEDMPTTSDIVRYVLEDFLNRVVEDVGRHSIHVRVPLNVGADVEWLINHAGYSDEEDVISTAVRRLIESELDKIERTERLRQAAKSRLTRVNRLGRVPEYGP